MSDEPTECPNGWDVCDDGELVCVDDVREHGDTLEAVPGKKCTGCGLLMYDYGDGQWGF